MNMNFTEQLQLQYRVEQFYYAEAAALDEWRYEDWVELFTEDTRYWMPVRRTRTASEQHLEFSELGSVAYFDDTKEILRARVRKLKTGLAWAEDPPSRTRRFINNVRILEDNGSELTISANFQVYRTRLDSEEDNWIGRREDVLRRTEDGFQIASRKIFLEQTVLLARNLSNFF